jgi:anti-sigma regulatory factor (Ser/Thr protein kinase)
MDEKFSNRIAVCVEEMASNTVTHGFAPGGGNHLSILLQHKNRRWVLRFRDDCQGFDPVHYVPPEGQPDALGIRLMLAMADEVHYTYSLSLNNLTLILNENKTEAEPAASKKP